MKTEPWARRVLNAQLASWAELRHDTLLYAKQSYTSLPACDFPDAYVDPYPEAWAGIVRLARLGQAIASALPASQPGTFAISPANLAAYFAQVETVAATLGGMAEGRARRPAPHQPTSWRSSIRPSTNRSCSVGCTQVKVPTGWYVRTVPAPRRTRRRSTRPSPTCTRIPTPRAVLHVATGLPRLMYVTVDGCNGPRAYAGLVSSYFEKTTTNFQRLTDMEWSTQLMATPPADVAWMTGLVVR